MFWRSVDLTGNQTVGVPSMVESQFWRSVDLTGNQTKSDTWYSKSEFWRSVDLTGNQTTFSNVAPLFCFGAVSI